MVDKTLVTIVVKISEGAREQLLSIAKYEKWTLSRVVRVAIDEFLDREHALAEESVQLSPSRFSPDDFPPLAIDETFGVRAITQPLSIGGLAARLGVPRQRIYTLVQKGQIRAVRTAGGLVIMPDVVACVLGAAVRVNTGKGRSRVVFDFI